MKRRDRIARSDAEVAEFAARCASAAARPMVEAQAAKRAGLQFVEQRCTSWDHAELAGAY